MVMETSLKELSPSLENLVGKASSSSTEEINKPCPDIQALWYFLIELEAKWRVELGIFDTYKQIYAGQIIVPMEANIFLLLVKQSIIDQDIDKFLTALPSYAYYTDQLAANQECELKSETSTDLPKLGDAIEHPTFIATIKDAIVVFRLFIEESNNPTMVSNLSSKLSRHSVLSSFQNFLNACDIESTNLSDSFISFNATMKYMLTADELDDPTTLFIHTCRSLEWVNRSMFKDLILPVLTKKLKERWDRVLVHQSFLLRSPLTNVPAIEAVLNNQQEADIRKLALLINILSPCVDVSLSQEYQNLITACLAKKLEIGKLQAPFT
jgi:hypothetical protein